MVVLNKRKVREKTKTFNWKAMPKCKYQTSAKMPNGLEVKLCKIHRGTGRHSQYCSSAGIEVKCPNYISVKRWGRNIYEMAGDLI